MTFVYLSFNETCQNTVPQAIIAFLEGTDFEDAIRNAISLGGDSTLAAITGSIAGRIWVSWLDWNKAYTYLDEPLKGSGQWGASFNNIASRVDKDNQKH